MPAIHVDVAALRAALDATRESRGLSWREAARQVGVSASTMSRMAQDHHPDVNAFVRMLWWLGMPYEHFTVTDGPQRAPEFLAEFALLLQWQKELDPPDVTLLEELVGAVMRRINAENMNGRWGS